MQTYWDVSVRIEGQSGSMSTGDVSLERTIERAITEAIYYQAVYPGQRVYIDGIRQVCSVCHNNGKLSVARKYKGFDVKRCPECKGKVPTATLDRINFIMPDSANRITLTAA